MNIKITLLLLSLIAPMNQLNAGEPANLNKKNFFDSAMAWLGESKFIQFVEKYYSLPIAQKMHKDMNIGTEPASEKYQQLSKEAQDSLQIPQEQQLPIIKINPTYILAPLVGALAEPNAIYVNQEKLDEYSYGIQRVGLFHEAVHTKYHDIANDGFLELVALIGGTVGSYFLINKIKPINKFSFLRAGAAIIAGLISSTATSLTFHHYIERRADIDGLYASACSQCVHEMAIRRRKSFEQDKSPLRYNGYLWANEIEKIAQDLARQNKVCKHHQDSK